MKSSRVHAVLSDIHRLLGDYLADDFLQASSYNAITPNVREALRALAQEAKRDSSSTSQNVKVKPQHSSTAAQAAKNVGSKETPEVFAMIRDSKGLLRNKLDN
jgi:dsDNA-specific endonuclease/ATPase MutS2